MNKWLVAKGVSVEQVNSALADGWTRLKGDEQAKDALIAAGVDPSLFDDAAVPFEAKRDSEQIGVAEGILIAMATAAATRLTQTAVDALWNAVARELKKRYGAQVKEKDADPPKE